MPANRVRRSQSSPTTPVLSFGREMQVTGMKETSGDAQTEATAIGLDLDYEFLFRVVDGKGTVAPR